jgi:hypothetical protein
MLAISSNEKGFDYAIFVVDPGQDDRIDSQLS